ncbi:hypothetical protein [Streptomyces sp. BH105]|uniref:hypothetical protein n=1 Tax=Streptomyces sp. BH105 TaxID=3410408 RepID=UPI003CF83195
MENPIHHQPAAEAEKPERVPGERFTVYFVMTMTVAAILLAFLFDFGNVWALAGQLGVPADVQALVAPAVSFSYLGLMVGQQYLALRGWSDRELVRPRIWLILMGVMTYGLNCAAATMRHDYGEALFDAVMPTLLLIWGEIGPWLMRQVHFARTEFAEAHQPATGEPDVAAAPLQQEIDELRQALEEIVAEAWARDFERDSRTAKKPGRRQSELRPVARRFIWKWKDNGKEYDDHPAAAWHKELVADMGDQAPTIERCRQIMREEFDKIEALWGQKGQGVVDVDKAIEEMEQALAA